MKRIYKALNITEAHIVAGMLEAHGIEVFVGGSFLQGGVGELAPLDIANVQVHEKDIELANELIAEYEARSGDIDDDEGEDYNYRSPEKTFLIGMFVFVILGIIFYIVR